MSIIICGVPRCSRCGLCRCPYCGEESADIEDFAVGMCWDCVYAEDS